MSFIEKWKLKSFLIILHRRNRLSIQFNFCSNAIFYYSQPIQFWRGLSFRSVGFSNSFCAVIKLRQFPFKRSKNRMTFMTPLINTFMHNNHFINRVDFPPTKAEPRKTWKAGGFFIPLFTQCKAQETLKTEVCLMCLF